MNRMSTVSLTDKRNDLHLTSSGVGHAIREKAVFPPLNFEVHEVIGACLVPELVSEYQFQLPEYQLPKYQATVGVWVIIKVILCLQHCSIPMGYEQQGLKYFIN